MKKSLENQLTETIPSKKKIAAVDTGGNILASLIIGTAIDTASGLNVAGIITSRAYGTAMNCVTGSPYGWWREQSYKFTRTTEESGKIRKTAADLLAFNTFQVPIYATALSVASLVSEGQIDFEKVGKGSLYLATISPFIGPAMGWFMDKFRGFCGVKSAAGQAYNNK